MLGSVMVIGVEQQMGLHEEEEIIVNLLKTHNKNEFVYAWQVVSKDYSVEYKY